MKLLLSNILYNLILTLFRFSVTVKFNHNSDLTLFHLKVSDTEGWKKSKGIEVIGMKETKCNFLSYFKNI